MDFVKIPGGTSQAQQIAAMNNNFGQLANESITKIYNDTNGVPHISIGIQKDGSSRIRIAKSGIDVNTASDDQLTFNSDQNVLKVVKIINFSIIQPAGTTNTYSRPHGLSYVPAVIGFLAAGGGLFRPLPTPVYITSDLTNEAVKIGAYIECQATPNDIQITFRNATTFTLGNYNFKVYVMQETAN